MRIDLTKEKDHTGLRKIKLDRSGPKLNKIYAQLESPTRALSTLKISIVTYKECGAAIYSKVVAYGFRGCARWGERSRILRNKESVFLLCCNLQTHTNTLRESRDRYSGE